MPTRMTPEEIRQTVAGYRWYHKIDLGGIVTPGHDFEPIWNNIRQVRHGLDYTNRAVLDLGSVDGMWAFEAERLGAAPVVATDCYYEQVYERFLFCREVLGSKVIPYYNLSPYDLWERLDVFFQENWEAQKPYQRRFDIVQHLGLLYHLRDPLRSLSQARSVLRTGGHLLIETAAVTNEDASFLLFNGVTPDRGRVYTDTTTWWAPTIPCLKDMLRASLFEPQEETLALLPQHVRDGRYAIARACLIARAVGQDAVHPEYYRELARTYRNPGLAADHLEDDAPPR